jgi:hypothetical protein
MRIKGVKAVASKVLVQRNDNAGKARASNHDGCIVSGWSVVKMLMARDAA